MKVVLKSSQWTVFRCAERFRVLVAGRRFGKTFLALTELIQAAWGQGRKVWYVAPTCKQAKRVAWKPLKQMTRPYWASRPNETDLTIELIAGGTISLRGADNYVALRGDGLDFIVLDEYASMAHEAWTEVLRPALADKQGRALFIGTPHGRNHFWNVYEAAQNQPHWATFQFTTEQGGNVSREELESATHELDERTYRQEFQASFENLGTGLAYYAFDCIHNVRPLQYDPKPPLFWAVDFNMNPLCSVLGQMADGIMRILEELILPDSNTLAACEEFLDRTRKWTTAPEICDPPLRPDLRDAFEETMRRLQPPPLNVYVYGDATGEQRKTSASRTDWQIVRDFFGRYTDRYHAKFQVPTANPPVKDRINCVNAMLRNHAGQHRLLIDPKCKQLIKDLEQVCWKSDPHGNPLAELDKSDPMRTHTSDAAGYLIARQFPMRARHGERAGPSLC
jgi:hypothetical protein